MKKTNFRFIVQKGKKMFRIKVNKLSKNTSIEAFNAVAKRITETFVLCNVTIDSIEKDMFRSLSESDLAVFRVWEKQLN